MILSYAHPTPRKKISVASLQLGMSSADVGFEFTRGIRVLNVVLPKIYSKLITCRSTLSVKLSPIAFIFLIYWSAIPP